MSLTTKYANLEYPRNEGPQFVQVGLVDVRAVDDIRISYDFKRDGWVIEQAQIFEWPANDKKCDPKWKEVAFIKAWASIKEGQ